jgi:CheY-like chemotaxis protein
MSIETNRAFPKFTILPCDLEEGPKTMNGQDTSPKQRWLVVDDDATLVELLTLILREQLQANVAGFTSGDEAWEDIVSHPVGVELVITDRDMPGIDGVELARRIQAQTPDTRVLLITAHHEDLDRDVLRQSGIHAVLPKPFTCEQFIAMIGKLLPDTIATIASESARLSVAA